MAELLRDNIEAEQRRGSASDTKSSTPKRREVPDILSWVQCFGAYARVCGQAAPAEADTAAGLPDHYHSGSPTVRGSWLAGVQCHVPAACSQCSQDRRLVTAKPISVCCHLHGSAERSGQDPRTLSRVRSCVSGLCPGPITASATTATSAPNPPPPPPPQGPGLGVADSRCPAAGDN